MSMLSRIADTSKKAKGADVYRASNQPVSSGSTFDMDAGAGAIASHPRPRVQSTPPPPFLSTPICENSGAPHARPRARQSDRAGAILLALFSARLHHELHHRKWLRRPFPLRPTASPWLSNAFPERAAVDAELRDFVAIEKVHLFVRHSGDDVEKRVGYSHLTQVAYGSRVGRQ